MDFEVIKGNDKPLSAEERHWLTIENIIDIDSVNLPKYNPRKFKIGRELEGLSVTEFAKAAHLSYKTYSASEKGDISPTEIQVDKIAKAQTHVLRGFFEQWERTESDFTQVVARPKAIDYYQYKVFRDINKPRTMKAVV